MKYKKIFLKSPSAFGLTLVIWLILISMLAGSIILNFSIDAPIFPLCIIVGVFLLFAFVVGLKFAFNIVIVTNEIITIRGVFGVLTTCKINEIQKVYRKEFFKEGTHIILHDNNRKTEKPYIYTKKNCYVRFQCRKKSLQILSDFWKDGIINLNTEQYPQDGITQTSYQKSSKKNEKKGNKSSK